MHPAYIQDDVETNLKLNFVFFLDNFHQFLEFSQETRLPQDSVKVCAKF